ncbi:MAG: response regulator [Cyanobacteria bacterium Co-bin8]|nr:response regulator [Cyanobacteria bacterium Co-bin8]
MSSRQATGCLKVTAEQGAWLLYLERGKLTYATTSFQPFDRLDLYLRRFSGQVPTLISAVRVQVRLLFEKADLPTDACPDYRAICWLVEQQHLPSDQAVALIETLSKEVLEGFLGIREGTPELLETDFLLGLPRLGQFSLRPMVEDCYNRLKQRQGNGSSAQPSSPMLQRNGDYRNATTTLPTAPAPYTAPDAPAPSRPDSGILKPSSKSTYTIACIDDSPTVLRAINDFLDDKMFSVLMISDPVKALMQVIRNKPDLILLDVTMPNLDGYELCSLLRRHSDFKHVPIIMVTSNTGFIDRAKAKLVRASGYLTKPFNQSDLLKIIFKHLS